MDLANAIEIIRALADLSRRSPSAAKTDGRDPATGRPFPPDSPYQRAAAKRSGDGQTDTVRALFTALEALERPGSSRRSPEGRKPIDPNKPKVGASWTPEEEQQLRDAFAAHNTQSENLPVAAKEAAFAACPRPLCTWA